jgi:hypothetical protein
VHVIASLYLRPDFITPLKYALVQQSQLATALCNTKINQGSIGSTVRVYIPCDQQGGSTIRVYIPCNQHSVLSTRVYIPCNQHSGSTIRVYIPCNEHSVSSTRVYIPCNQHSGSTIRVYIPCNQTYCRKWNRSRTFHQTLHIEVVKPYRLTSTSNTCEHSHPRQDVKNSAHIKPTTPQLL